MKNFAAHKGMTLIEVLIVVSVIITIATSMFLSSTQATGTADAAKIIADLTTIRKAALAWEADNRERLKANYRQGSPTHIHTSTDITKGIAKYIDNNENFTLNNGGSGKLALGGYGVCEVTKHRTTWYVGYKFANGESHLKEKLRGRAKSAGLHFSTEWPNPLGDNNKYNNYNDDNTGDNIVWMYVKGDLSETSW